MMISTRIAFCRDFLPLSKGQPHNADLLCIYNTFDIIIILIVLLLLQYE